MTNLLLQQPHSSKPEPSFPRKVYRLQKLHPDPLGNGFERQQRECWLVPITHSLHLLEGSKMKGDNYAVTV